MSKIELVTVGGFVIGFGIAMLLGAFTVIKPTPNFDPTLLGLAITLFSFGLMFWDKAGFFRRHINSKA